MINPVILRMTVFLTVLIIVPPAVSQWSSPLAILPEAMPSTPDFDDPPPIAPMIASTATSEALHLVWSQVVNDNIEIFHARRLAGSWSTPVNVSKAAGVSVFPVLIASSDGTVHCAWTEFYEDSAEVYYANLATDGTWQPPFKLTRADNVPFHAFPMLTANAENEVHCMWSNVIEGVPNDQRSLSYRKKPANGEWSAELATPMAEIHAFRPSIAFDRNGILHCVWYDGLTTDPSNPQRRIDYSFLSSSGWSAPITLAKGSISDDLPIAFAATSDDELHVFGYDFLSSSGFSIRKDASGWQAPRSFNRPLFNAQLVATQSQVHAIYEIMGGVEHAVFKSGDWQPGVLLQDANARFQTITGDESSLHAFWLEASQPDAYEIMYSQMPLNISGVRERESESTPDSFQLFPIHPNPFSQTTEIEMMLATDTEVELMVFDAQGRLIRTLMQGQEQNGWHTIQWDGADDHGKSVANGIYFIRLQVLSNGGTISSLSRSVLFIKE